MVARSLVCEILLSAKRHINGKKDHWCGRVFFRKHSDSKIISVCEKFLNAKRQIKHSREKRRLVCKFLEIFQVTLNCERYFSEILFTNKGKILIFTLVLETASGYFAKKYTIAFI